MIKNLKDYLDNKFPEGFAGHRAFYSFTHPWVILEYCREQIVYAWERVFNQYDRRVVWSIDWYLAEKIPLWVRELKTKKYGTPIEMFDGMEHDKNYGYSKEDEKLAKEKWENILEEIAIGFESYLLGHDYYKQDDYKKDLDTKFNRGFDLFRQYFGNLWD